MKDVLGLASDYAAQFLGISQAGNVNTGAFDPLEARRRLRALGGRVAAILEAAAAVSGTLR